MNTLKTGSSSILLGAFYYKDYLPYKKNKLVKVTKITNRHNEFLLLNEIKKINYFRNYYNLPEDKPNILLYGTPFYNHVQTIADEVNIFNDKLYYFYIDYLGEMDLYDTIIDVIKNKNLKIWDSYKTILKFAKHMLEGLYFLHQKKICHLDIKPENIMINTKNKSFKIIDFGFASIEPFNNFIDNYKGTPGYFPMINNDLYPTKWLPKIIADDMIPVDGITPYKKNFKLVYKLDSFCLGRTLFYIRYIFKDNKRWKCFNFDRKNENKLNQIIKLLIEPKVNKRSTPKECLNKIFKKHLSYQIV